VANEEEAEPRQQGAQEDDGVLLRFPMSFEETAPGACPSGWVCSGEARVCSHPPLTRKCLHPGISGVEGSRYLAVGDDFTEANVTSAAFYLPWDASRLEFRQCGGANAGSGFYVHLHSNRQLICSSEDGLDSNAFSISSCVGLAAHAGQAVYISLRDMQRSTWGKVLVDDIRLKSTAGEDIASVEKVPPLKVRREWHWIFPPRPFVKGHRASIVSYAGKDKQAYIDGAVMLGLSLDHHVPEFPRYCMVDRSMSAENKGLLSAVGWNLLELEDWHPTGEHFAQGYWWDVYNKINLFRLRLPPPLLYMDADTYVLNSHLREVLEMSLPPEKIAMVPDLNHDEYNTGLMFFYPDLGMYARLHDEMTKREGWAGLDQPLINEEYEGRIVELDTKFNTHGSATPDACERTVVAHFTGRNKPSLASQTNLMQVRTGYHLPAPYLQCPGIYRAYYCDLTASRRHLSLALQAALAGIETGTPCTTSFV